MLRASARPRPSARSGSSRRACGTRGTAGGRGRRYIQRRVSISFPRSTSGGSYRRSRVLRAWRLRRRAVAPLPRDRPASWGSSAASTATSSPRSARSSSRSTWLRGRSTISRPPGPKAWRPGRIDAIGVMLPSASLVLDRPMPPARDLIDAGAAIALATDFNPGSSFCESLPLVMALAVARMHMTPAEALAACTVNAAAVLGQAERSRPPACRLPGGHRSWTRPDWRYLTMPPRHAAREARLLRRRLDARGVAVGGVPSEPAPAWYGPAVSKRRKEGSDGTGWPMPRSSRATRASRGPSARPRRRRRRPPPRASGGRSPHPRCSARSSAAVSCSWC